MSKKIILRLSNELGNQMFMYASAYSIAKKLNRELYIDNETAFLTKKNVSNYRLSSFNISSSIAPDKYKFKKLSGYIKRKFLIKSDFLNSKRKFFIENKDKNKITSYSNDYKSIQFDDCLFLEGHYESEKYFDEIKDEIKKEFKIKDFILFQKNQFFKDLNKQNSVGICLRQNRFIEGVNQNTQQNKEKSWNYTLEQINYINKSADIIKSKISNPSFFLWTNDFSNLEKNKFNFNYVEVNLKNDENNLDKKVNSLFLLRQCNHFIATSSSFSWWGTWLSEKENKIILRPSNKFFSKFTINNQDFWPLYWNMVDV